MDKERSRDVIMSFRLIIVGIFFWIIKVKYITQYFLPENHFFNSVGLEIVGTIMILVGITCIRRLYPFAFAMISQVYIIFIALFHTLHLFLYKNSIFAAIYNYNFFLTTIMLFFIAKLFQNGLRYFGGSELSRKWKYFAIIIFSGLIIPIYLFTTLYICGFITFKGFQFNSPIILLFIPFLLAILSIALFYLKYLVKSFNFLSAIEKNNKPQAVKK